MNALPYFSDFLERRRLDELAEEEAAQERLGRQKARELTKRDTWFDGFNDCVTAERPTNPSPIIDALMAGDYHHAGELIHKHITEVYAEQKAQDAIDIDDEDAANDY